MTGLKTLVNPWLLHGRADPRTESRHVSFNGMLLERLWAKPEDSEARTDGLSRLLLRTPGESIIQIIDGPLAVRPSLCTSQGHGHRGVCEET